MYHYYSKEGHCLQQLYPCVRVATRNQEVASISLMECLNVYEPSKPSPCPRCFSIVPIVQMGELRLCRGQTTCPEIMSPAKTGSPPLEHTLPTKVLKVGSSDEQGQHHIRFLGSPPRSTTTVTEEALKGLRVIRWTLKFESPSRRPSEEH